jgi:DNA modification methylase
VDRIFLGDCRQMKEVPDESVDLVVCSPPYNNSRAYANYSDNLPWDEYMDFLKAVWLECMRVLKVGGRLAVNTNQVNRQPSVPVPAMVTCQLIDLGFLMRGLIVWNKGVNKNCGTAWGSYLMPTNPILRDSYELVSVFSKSTFKIPKQDVAPDITKEEFLEWSKSLWTIPCESAKRIGHPAPFPVELPRRLIKFYTYPGSTILDPFCGSGTTAVAAKMLGRHYIGYDISQEYIDIANRRLAEVDTLRDMRPTDKPQKQKRKRVQTAQEDSMPLLLPIAEGFREEAAATVLQ